MACIDLQVLQEVTGKPTLYYREGGTIPAMALLKKELGIDMTMFAFGLPDDRIHAPNERYAQPLWVLSPSSCLCTVCNDSVNHCSTLHDTLGPKYPLQMILCLLAAHHCVMA